ncbi:hypothetical protein [Moorena producens]|uniref:hypothetical protein n=1 Tax=Moorena producens TaxID=1155739 RepID=UPI003C74AB6D
MPQVRPVANLIRLRKTHHYGLGGSPHSRFASRRDVTDGVHPTGSEIWLLAYS